MILWNLETGEPIRRLQGHKGAVLSAAFTPDALHAVSVSMDATARLWDLDGAGETHRLSVPDCRWGLMIVKTVILSFPGEYVCWGSQRYDLMIWTPILKSAVMKDIRAIHDISVSPDGEQALPSAAMTASDWGISTWCRAPSLLRSLSQSVK
jgi:WD40 repeat protein